MSRSKAPRAARAPKAPREPRTRSATTAWAAQAFPQWLKYIALIVITQAFIVRQSGDMSTIKAVGPYIGYTLLALACVIVALTFIGQVMAKNGGVVLVFIAGTLIATGLAWFVALPLWTDRAIASAWYLAVPYLGITAWFALRGWWIYRKTSKAKPASAGNLPVPAEQPTEGVASFFASAPVA